MSDIINKFNQDQLSYNDAIKAIKSRRGGSPQGDKKEDKPFYLGDALLGAGNGLLFGIPEWIAKQTAGENAVENWKKEHSSGYESGGVVGDVASGFIPVAGLVGKGLQLAKGVGKLGQGVAKLGRGIETVDKMAKMGKGGIGSAVKAGALEGVTQSGLRNLFADEDEKTNVIGDAALGGAFGGVGGALGNILKKGQKGGEKLLEEATDKSAEAVVKSMGNGGRAFVQNLKKFGGPGSNLSKITKVDPLIRETADVINKYKLNRQIDRDGAFGEAYQKVSKAWDKIADMAESTPGFAKSADDAVLNKAAEISDNLKKPGAIDRTNPNTGKELSNDDIDNTIQGLVDNTQGAESFIQKRKYLQNIIDQNSDIGRRTIDPLSRVKFDAAIALKNQYDNAVDDLVKNSGQKDLLDTTKDWRSLNILADEELKATGRHLGGSFGAAAGSTTYEKMLTNQVLKGEEGAADALVNMMGSGIIGNAVGKGVQYLKTRGTAALYDKLKKAEESGLPEKLQKYEALAPIAKPGALGLSALSQDGKKQEVYEAPDRGDAAKSAVDQIYSSIMGAPPNESDQEYQDFSSQILPILQSNPDKLYEILGAGDVGANANIVNEIASNLNEAEKAHGADAIPLIGGGISNILAPKEAKNAENRIVSAFTNAIKNSGGSNEQAREIIKNVLSSGGSQAQKMQKLFEEWGQIDPQAILKMRQAGMI